ncbi:MAG TPA: nuclear transport factor 2 family protein [Actinoplanes sp.]|nr:nuclear transport factor 2 family protein [Actinoplanes sp.]
MDEAGVRAALQRYIDHSGAGDEDRASEIYHDDAVLEFPQSGERFDGVANFREWRRIYPAEVELEIVRIRGAGDVWVAEMRARYNGGAWLFGPAIYEFRGDKVARETIYVAEAWEAPEWRAKWRATDG